MSTLEPGTPEQQRSGVPWRAWLRAFIPYLITVIVAISASIAIQSTLPGSPPLPASVAPTPTNTRVPTQTPTIAQPTSPPLAEGIAQQELADLRADLSRVYAMVYLYKALAQLSDAETLLRANDLQSVDQALIAVDDSLALAYERADELSKNPIEQLRRDINLIRNELFLYPENMDARLTRLRQTILVLIDER